MLIVCTCRMPIRLRHAYGSAMRYRQVCEWQIQFSHGTANTNSMAAAKPRDDRPPSAKSDRSIVDFCIFGGGNHGGSTRPGSAKDKTAEKDEAAKKASEIHELPTFGGTHGPEIRKSLVDIQAAFERCRTSAAHRAAKLLLRTLAHVHLGTCAAGPCSLDRA